MKVQILSDLHLDINRSHPFNLADTDTFTIIAGDISGHPKETIEWVRNNVKNGVFVEGNHIGYNSMKRSIQYIQTQLEKEFPIDSNVSYLYDNYKIIGDYVFVGGILFTDYNLYGEGMNFYNKQVAMMNLNDFRYNRFNSLYDRPTDEQDGYLNTTKVTPSNYESMFIKTFNAIKNVCEMFPDKKIVVVTHHAPSAKSIDIIYETDKANGSYASNLENFILDHSNIKLWCHGHIHSSSDYMIGDCRVICNPRGYENYRENNHFDSRLIIDI